ncbi:MAG: Dabb family protein [Henriciella sp.]
MRVAMLLGLMAMTAGPALADETKAPLLTHSVFFDLKNDDAASVQALVDGCYEYLAPHDGIVYFSAGARHTDYQREVNDLNFDVALTIVFENTAAQDAYQVTEPHLQFIEEFNENWESVRVFDSLAPALHGD